MEARLGREAAFTTSVSRNSKGNHKMRYKMEREGYTWNQMNLAGSQHRSRQKGLLERCKDIKPGLPEISAITVLLVFLTFQYLGL